MSGLWNRAMRFSLTRYLSIKLISLLIAMISIIAFTPISNAISTQPSQPTAILLEIQGAIGPGMADYVVRSLKTAETNKATVAVIQMDTPGG